MSKTEHMYDHMYDIQTTRMNKPAIIPVAILLLRSVLDFLIGGASVTETVGSGNNASGIRRFSGARGGPSADFSSVRISASCSSTEQNAL